MRVLQQDCQRLTGGTIQSRSSLRTAWRSCLSVVILTCVLGSSGCTTVLVSATNPIPGLTTVAVAPFTNLSAEPSADGRRVALAYFAELQKNPGFQVVPVGIVEQTIVDNNLSMNSPADAMELARLLKVDAVVVGAITDYRPYYPPQIGMQVQWYSPRSWVFYPGIPSNTVGEEANSSAAPAGTPVLATQPLVRAQSADDGDSRVVFPESLPSAKSPTRLQQTQGAGRGGGSPSTSWPTRRRDDLTAAGTGSSANSARKPQVSAESRKLAPRQTGAGNSNGPGLLEEPPQVELKELMSYTRFFDALDPELVKSLKAYVLYRNDLRSGGWEAHMHRSDDFIKFAAHRMVVEMLALHGGTLKTQTMFTFWK